jgi:hypothetical protein
MIQESRFSYKFCELSKVDKYKLLKVIWENTKIFLSIFSVFMIFLALRLMDDPHTAREKINILIYFILLFFIFFFMLNGKHILDLLLKQKIVADTYIINTGAQKLKNNVRVKYINTEVKANKTLTIAIPENYITSIISSGDKIQISISKYSETLLDFRII